MSLLTDLARQRTLNELVAALAAVTSRPDVGELAQAIEQRAAAGAGGRLEPYVGDVARRLAKVKAKLVAAGGGGGGGGAACGGAPTGTNARLTI